MKIRIEKRPKIKLQLSTFDKTLEILGWLSIVVIWLLIIIYYDKLPDKIPTHFNALGKVDGFGAKTTILTLPRMATFLFIGITILNKFPQAFNYMTNITNENALQEYTSATRTIRYLKLIVAVIFGILTATTIKSAHGDTDDPGIGFLPLIIAPLIISLLYFMIMSSKSTK